MNKNWIFAICRHLPLKKVYLTEDNWNLILRRLYKYVEMFYMLSAR